MKTAVSIPDELFEEADAFAKRAGKSRSEVYADALRDHLKREADCSVTQRLDEVHGGVDLDDDDRRWLEGIAVVDHRSDEW